MITLVCFLGSKWEMIITLETPNRPVLSWIVSDEMRYEITRPEPSATFTITLSNIKTLNFFINLILSNQCSTWLTLNFLQFFLHQVIPFRTIIWLKLMYFLSISKLLWLESGRCKLTHFCPTKNNTMRKKSISLHCEYLNAKCQVYSKPV